MSCDNCSEGNFLPGNPTGTFTKDGTYFMAGPAVSTDAVMLLTDAFGLPLMNCKILADNFSKHLGCDM
jgi:carboxymethylenebutenolidase